MRCPTWIRAGLCALSLCGTLAIGPMAAAAQDAGAAEDPAGDRATSFRAVSGPDAEQVPGGPLLISAYGIIFLLLLLYIFRLGRLQAGIARDVDRLERNLAKSRQPVDGD